MRFRSIGAMNFRSLRNVQLDLRRPPGLYFMTGYNRDRPALGRNGVGKSSIWQAMRWCLFGSTSEGGRAEALKGPSKEAAGYGAEVKVGKQRLARNWHPNWMEVNGETCSSFDDVMPLTDVEFDASVLACQGGTTILDYTPSQRLELVSSVLDLERWSTLSGAASVLAKQREDSLRSTALKIGGTRSAIEELKQLDMRQQIKAFERERQGAIAKLRSKLRDLKTERANLRADFTRLTQEKSNKEAVLPVAEDLLRKRQETFDLDKKSREGAVADLLRAQERLSAAQRLMKHLRRAHEGANCELCGSVMTAKQRSQRIEVISADVAAGEDKLDAIMKILKAKDAEIFSADKRVQQAREIVENGKEDIKELAGKITGLLFDIPKKEHEVEEVRKLIGVERHKTNPMGEADNARLTKLHARRAELQTLRHKEIVQSKALGRAQWWITGFKDVRYYVLEEALAELTAVTQAHLLVFGMHGYSLEFVAEKEAKSGNVSRTFDVRITHPSRRIVLPLQAFSGGEQQRMRLAASFALSDFLLRRRSLTCNLEVYDEPTSHLSQEGIDAVVELLKARALQARKQIWLVDHHAINSTAFADTVVLELKHGVTRIIS